MKKGFKWGTHPAHGLLGVLTRLPSAFCQGSRTCCLTFPLQLQLPYSLALSMQLQRTTEPISAMEMSLSTICNVWMPTVCLLHMHRYLSIEEGVTCVLKDNSGARPNGATHGDASLFCLAPSHGSTLASHLLLGMCQQAPLLLMKMQQGPQFVLQSLHLVSPSLTFLTTSCVWVEISTHVYVCKQREAVSVIWTPFVVM